MNDADFEMLANQAGGAHEMWLRSAALGHAIRWREGTTHDAELLVVWANRFYEYIKGGE